jgi:signal transduction histidine kinase
VQGALLSVLLNALEHMPNEGRLVISAEGRTKSVTVRVRDTGPGMSAQPDASSGRALLVNDRRRTAIGLQVAGAIVESHDGRIEWLSNVPHGTSVEITFPSASTKSPSASTERLRHGPRTYR